METGASLGGEQQMVSEAMRAMLAAHWPADKAPEYGAAPDKVAEIWREMAAQGFAEIGPSSESGGLGMAVTVARELGRAACPAPFIPAVVANMLRASDTGPALADAGLGQDRAVAIAFGRHDGDAAAGEPAWSGSGLTGTVRFVEHAEVATDFLVAVEGGLCAVPATAPGFSRLAAPGLSVPALAELRFEAVAATFVKIAEATLDDAATVARLLLTARAAGAAERNFEMAVEHVGTRVQFGRPLAKFQSMQHKLADCYLAIDASTLEIAAAAAAADAASPDWRLQADLAIAFACAELRKCSMEVQHAFGAIGYAEEHEAPRHFRRIHADLSRMGGQRRARAAIAKRVLGDPRRGLPARRMGDEVEALRSEFREWLAANWQTDGNAFQPGRDPEFARRMGRGGWLSLAWPVEAGGGGASPLKQLALVEELTRANAPTIGITASAWLLAPEIIRHGSQEMKEALLPGIRSGEFHFALGYSEPEAGSDLAALRTRAVRDGDDYLITGQKLWGTGTEHATHIVVATKTDPDAKPKSSGISVFIVPADLPGITIQPGMALYGHTFCTQFFDEVRVPATAMLGEENRGWGVLTGALAAERIQMGGKVVAQQRLFEQLSAHIAQDPALRDDRSVSDMLGRFAAEIDAARQLSQRSVEMLEAGRTPIVEGAMTKVFSGQLAESFAQAAMDILGTSGTLGKDAPGAPLGGWVEWALRESVMLVIGGGAAEVQKTIIATRGIGLSA